MKKRVLIAIFLSMLVLVIYSLIIPDPMPPPKDQKIEQPVQKQEEKAAALLAEATIVYGAAGQEERTVAVETDLYKAVFTNRGGVIKHWELKNYWVDFKKTRNIRLFSDPGENIVGAYPFAVNVNDSGLNKLFQNGLFSIDGGDIYLNDKNPKGELSFTIVDPKSGKGLKKTFTFFNDSYRVDVDIIPINVDETYTISTGSNFGITDYAGEGFALPTTLLGTKVINDRTRINVEKIEGPIYHDGDIKWTALQDLYFMSALIPKGKVSRVIVKHAYIRGIQAEVEVPDGQKAPFMLYAGPKEYMRLKGLGVNLEVSIPQPIIWFYPILWILRFFYRLVGNYGLAIMILVVVVRGILLPFTTKIERYLKMLKYILAGLQIRLDTVRRKFSEDPSKAYFEEVVGLEKLYMQYKGDLKPIRIIIPIIVQSYTILGLLLLFTYNIELRNELLSEPFGWIQDLSQKDPYYLLPIIFCWTLAIKQGIILPYRRRYLLYAFDILIWFMFLNFPSGFLLFISTLNVLSIIQWISIGQKLQIENIYKEKLDTGDSPHMGFDFENWLINYKKKGRAFIIDDITLSILCSIFFTVISGAILFISFLNPSYLAYLSLLLGFILWLGFFGCYFGYFLWHPGK